MSINANTQPPYRYIILGASRQGTAAAYDLVDYFDPETGFTSMARLTGWHCAILMGFQALGVIQPSVVPRKLPYRQPI